MNGKPKPMQFYIHGADVLDPFSAHKVEHIGGIFQTAEHAYQAHKFFQCHQPEVFGLICEAESPEEAKQIAFVHRSKRRRDWPLIKLDVMEDILRSMFERHRSVREVLAESLRTGQDIVEASPDLFWGTGSNCTGSNQLGKLWMKIRDEKTKELQEEFPEKFL